MRKIKVFSNNLHTSTFSISSIFLLGFRVPKILLFSVSLLVIANTGGFVVVLLAILRGFACVKEPGVLTADLMKGGNIAVRPALMLGGTWNAFRHIFSQHAGHRALFVHRSSFHCCERTIGGT